MTFIRGVLRVNSNQTVREYLEELGLGHLSGLLKGIGIDELTDFIYVFVEDLVEMGLNYEDAQRILRPFHASNHHRPEGPWPAGARGSEVREGDVRLPEGWITHPAQPLPASQSRPSESQSLSHAALLRIIRSMYPLLTIWPEYSNP